MDIEKAKVLLRHLDDRATDMCKNAGNINQGIQESKHCSLLESIAVQKLYDKINKEHGLFTHEINLLISGIENLVGRD